MSHFHNDILWNHQRKGFWFYFEVKSWTLYQAHDARKVGTQRITENLKTK